MSTNSERGYGRCYFRVRHNGESHGACERHGVEFDTRKEYEEHLRQMHPIECSDWDCDELAAYKHVGSPHSYCADHFEDTEGSYQVQRVTRPANADAPRLPDDHSVEVVLQGLEGDPA